MLSKIFKVKKKSNLFKDFKFDNLKIEKVNNYIFYRGSVINGRVIVGFIDNEGKGEEFLILDKEEDGNFIRFKTTLNFADFKTDYLTQGLIENLVRVKAKWFTNLILTLIKDLRKVHRVWQPFAPFPPKGTRRSGAIPLFTILRKSSLE